MESVDVFRHYATEMLFVLPLFGIVLVILRLASIFAWSDETISTLIIISTVICAGIVLLRGDQIIEWLFNRVERRK
jgi:hypothetical protein